MMKDFREDFYKLKAKLETGENFAFSRFSDGEMYILQGIELKLDQNLIQIGDRKSGGPYEPKDFKHFDPKQHQEFHQHMISAFTHRQPNYYKGISCSCCVGKPNFDWQIDLHGGDDESLTWANLFLNGNYGLFVEEVLPLFYNKKCVFVGHKDATLNKFPFFVNDFRVGYNAMINDVHVIEDMRNWIRDNDISDHVFLFSASSFTCIAIYDLYKEFPNNTYIDIGTSLAPMMDMPWAREYLRAYWNKGDTSTYRGQMCIWN